MRPLHVTVLAGAVALAAALGVPAQAEGLGGADGVRYQRGTVTVPAGAGQPTHARGEVTCPKGWTAVGGGHTIRPGGDRGIAAGTKLGNRQWVAEAWQVDGGASTLTAYAVCLRTDRISEEDQTEYELPAGPLSVTQSGSCPGGHVVSGGVTYYGGHAEEFTLNSAYPVDDGSDPDTVRDDGWRGRVQYTGPGGASVSVYLVCLGGRSPAYRRTSVTVPAGESARARALCPRGRPVLGGGVRASGPGSASHVVGSRPVDRSDAGTVPEDGWVGGITNTSAQDLTLTVHAVCR
jgi:hypothetical protein